MARISRAASNARNHILEQLVDDHKRVRRAYRAFQKLRAGQDSERCEQIVREVLRELSVHAALEEGFLYLAARGSASDTTLDEAEVEHEVARSLIDQLRQMNPEEDQYAARFVVLCEYVLHHVKEEEGVLFAELRGARLEWEALAQEMNDRRAGLSQGPANDADVKEIDTESGPTEAGPTTFLGGTGKTG